MSSTGPLGLSWVTNTPPAPRPNGGAPAPTSEPEPQAQPEAHAPAQDRSSVSSGQGLLMEWAGSQSTSTASSSWGMEWATSSYPATSNAGFAPAGADSGGNGLSMEWRSGSTTVAPAGGTPPAGNPPTTSNGLGLEWKTGSTTPTEESKPSGSRGTSGWSGSLEISWSGSVAKPDPEAERLAELKGALVGPLPAIPERPKTDSWRQNDLVNRADLIRAIRNDPALQTAFEQWETLSNDVKMAAGNRISALEGAIYGFEPAPIKLDVFLQKPSYGYYHPTEDRVHISPDTLADVREFVNTVTHEQAHAYQWEKGNDAKTGRMSSADPLYETAQVWYDNFFAYAQPNKGYQAYRTQPIEAHAFATGDGIAAGVFS